jgi:hypothetical protein
MKMERGGRIVGQRAGQGMLSCKLQQRATAMIISPGCLRATHRGFCLLSLQALKGKFSYLTQFQVPNGEVAGEVRIIFGYWHRLAGKRAGGAPRDDHMIMPLPTLSCPTLT